MNNLEHLGIMLDCSRNAVMNVTTVKKTIDLMEKMGFNTLMLYTEDTWEVNNNPYFGHLRGRYTKQEMKELDTYAKEHGIELIPCIQTLAHLSTIFRWPKYSAMKDCEDILCVGNEKVYELIEDMFATIEECFTTRTVHVGMDEAHMLGMERYRAQNGYEDQLTIFVKHLKRVAEIGAAHGFQLLIWNDMLYRLSTGVSFEETHIPITQEKADEIRSYVPDNVELVYWDYDQITEEHYDINMQNHKKISENFWYGAGSHTWFGFAPHNNFTMLATPPAMDACNKHSVKHVIFTFWRNRGAECSTFAGLPAFYQGLCRLRGICDEAEMKKGFEETFGMAFDDFMLLELPDTPNDYEGCCNTEKYMLYNDPFLSVLDLGIEADAGERFGKCAKKLALHVNHPEWGHLFESMQRLCEVLEIKANLGQRTRQAYQEQDREVLTGLIAEYQICIERIEIFYKAYQKQWMRNNKPYGFDVFDIHIGGLIQRMKHCKERLTEYTEGKLESIPELEERMLDIFGKGEYYEKTPLCYDSWQRIATVNYI